RGRRSRARPAPRRHRRRDLLRAVPGRRPAGHPQAGPDPGDRRRHRRRRRPAPQDRGRAAGRRRARRGARRRRVRGRTRLGDRPDRRHEELLPRRAGVGHADRAHGARGAGGRSRERARAGQAVAGLARGPGRGGRGWAAPGQGAWTSDAGGTRRIGVSGVTDLADAYLSTTDVKAFAELGRRDDYLRLVDACWETRAFGDFWMYCLVAEGVIDLAVDATANAWDLAALV